MTYHFNFLGTALNPSSPNNNDCLRTEKKEPYIKFSIAVDLGFSKGNQTKPNTSGKPELSSEKKTLWINVLVFFKGRQNADGMILNAEIPERFNKLNSQNVVYGRGKILNTRDNSITVVVEPRDLIIYSLGDAPNTTSGKGKRYTDGTVEDTGVKFFEDLLDENKRTQDEWF